MMTRELTIALTALLFCVSSADAQAPGFPLEPVEVEIVNLPESQTVSGSVEVTNLPSVQAVEIVEADREQVRVSGLDTTDMPDFAQLAIAAAGDDFAVDLGTVPVNKKLVITDIQVRSRTALNSWHCATIAGADDCAEPNVFDRRHIQICVPPNYAAPMPNPNDAYDYFKMVSLTTGIEFFPGQKVCLAAAGGRTIAGDPDPDFVQVDAVGYLTNQ